MNYLALTIGPIIETLSESKKTKELFGGSYLFSHFMKELLYRLKASGYELIVPYHTDIDDFFSAQNGIGMFHDRLIVSHDKEQKLIQDDIDNFIKNIIDKIVSNIVDMENHNKQYKEKILEFFEQYLQISYVITDTFSLNDLTNMLDVAELHREFMYLPDTYKVLYDQEKNRVNPLVYLQKKFHKSFLKDEAFSQSKNRFPSVLDIALLLDEDNYIKYTFDNKEDKKLEEEALRGKKNHQKYIALIQGDGDKIGAILKTMDSDPKKIQLFSEKLLDFVKKIPAIAQKYKAHVVYAGGDDMLAFSPIITKNKDTIFDFLVELDEVFKSTMKELNIPQANDVSQSFGVSLVYYKKPLYQALDKAINNLFYVAKASDNRNRAVVELIKHSGQTYVTDITLSSDIYKSFNILLKLELHEKKSNLPHAVTHNIARSKSTLKALGDKYDKDELKAMVDNFFINNFNKEVHDIDNNLSLIESKKLLMEYLKLYAIDTHTDRDKTFEKYFIQFTALLSMIKHLRGDR